MDFSTQFCVVKHGGLHAGFATSEVSRKRFPDG